MDEQEASPVTTKARSEIRKVRMKELSRHFTIRQRQCLGSSMTKNIASIDTKEPILNEGLIVAVTQLWAERKCRFVKRQLHFAVFR